MQIRLGICDDINYLCEYFKSMFDMESDIEFVGIANSSKECVKMVEETDIDVLLLDIQMECNCSGIDLIGKIREIKPDIKIIMFTIHEDDEFIIQSFTLGANDYIAKTVPFDELVNSIKNVYNNKTVLRPEIAKVILNECQKITNRQNSLLHIFVILSRLSASEFEILKDLYFGATYTEIAAKRCVEVLTIRSQCAKILKKFNAKRMRELIEDLKSENIFEIFDLNRE